ncbi:hypothetical protein Tco_0428372 [Tanacetum coccineum]
MLSSSLSYVDENSWFVILNKLIECQIVDNCKKDLGYEYYNVVPPPYTGNFMPPTLDLSFTGLDEFVNKPVVKNRNSDEEVSKVVRKSDDSGNPIKDLTGSRVIDSRMLNAHDMEHNIVPKGGLTCLFSKATSDESKLWHRRLVDSFDDLFDYLSQFEKLVNASRAKKLEKSHDPLALVAHTGSSSRNTSSYYVTHPSSVVDYDEEYEQDDVHNHSEDPLASAMLLLAKAITQNFSNPTNNRLRASSNTRNQAVVQGDRVNIQSRNSGNVGRNNRRAYVQEEVVEGMNATNETANVQRIVRTPTPGNTSTGQCYNCGGKKHYARNFPKQSVRDSKYFMEPMLLAKQDEASVILTDEQNDFLFADASRMEEIEELSANICLMARIQPADQKSDDEPSYVYAFISEVQSSSINENVEQMYPTHTKIINSTIDDDQINSNIQFNSIKGNVNSGSVEKDTYVYDLCALETLSRNAYDEAAKQQSFAQNVQQQNMSLTSQIV